MWWFKLKSCSKGSTFAMIGVLSPYQVIKLVNPIPHAWGNYFGKSIKSLDPVSVTSDFNWLIPSRQKLSSPPPPLSLGGLGGDFLAKPINVSILNGLIDALLCNIKCFKDVLLVQATCVVAPCIEQYIWSLVFINVPRVWLSSRSD